ncbi:hypothetical protein OAH18_03545 [bacterium]|nr:hypothetical protein [bacterium]
MKFVQDSLVLVLVTIWMFLSSQCVFAQELVKGKSAGDWENLYMANYVQAEDLPVLRKLGVNAVLMEIESNPQAWKNAYQAVAKHEMRLVPVLWGKHQSIWKWNTKQQEWELDSAKYPKSKGAKFIEFLKSDERARQHTLAVYSFHEPWYMGEREKGKKKRKGTVEPERQRKFWQQIRQIFDGKMKVYGEEVTWVPECKNGCVDYDYVTLYSFAKRDGVAGYRPGGRFQVGDFGIDGSQAPFQNDKSKAKAMEHKQIDLMHRMIQTAPAAPDGTRTKLIALMGTFAHDEEPDLWNRMPTSDEMREWGREIIRPNRHRLAGMGWYAFRNPTDYYKQVLFTDRMDPAGKDRWQAIGDVFDLVRQKTARGQ